MLLSFQQQHHNRKHVIFTVRSVFNKYWASLSDRLPLFAAKWAQILPIHTSTTNNYHYVSSKFFIREIFTY